MIWMCMNEWIDLDVCDDKWNDGCMNGMNG